MPRSPRTSSSPSADVRRRRRRLLARPFRPCPRCRRPASWSCRPAPTSCRRRAAHAAAAERLRVRRPAAMRFPARRQHNRDVRAPISRPNGQRGERLRARLRPDRGPEGVGRFRSARSGREQGMRPSYRHANRMVPGALPNALIPAGPNALIPTNPSALMSAGPSGVVLGGPSGAVPADPNAVVASGTSSVIPAGPTAVVASGAGPVLPVRAVAVPGGAGISPAGARGLVPSGARGLAPSPAIVVHAGGNRPRTGGGPGVRGRRGRSSPVLTWSPELSRSVPASPCPRAARLPMKISPDRSAPILDRCHSNVGCWVANRRFRIQVR
ncbi:hypothetical protein QFZ71_003470 [Streptomyces sp. V2I9]|nr:hypothetical protein [Streptomyces sp. V2I9]